MTPHPNPHVAGDLFPELLDGWCGPVEFLGGKFEARADAAVLGFDTRPESERAGRFTIASAEGWYVMQCFVETLSVNADEVRLDLTRPECRAQLSRVLARGLKCAGGSACPGREPLCASAPCPINGEGCDGYERRPAPAWHLLPESEGGRLPDALAAHSPALLAGHAESVARGGAGIVGVLGEWAIEDDRRPRRRERFPEPDRRGLVVVDRLNPGSDRAAPFWALWDSMRRDDWGRLDHIASGPETGNAGKTAADAAALAHGFALLDADTLHLPEVPHAG